MVLNGHWRTHPLAHPQAESFVQTLYFEVFQMFVHCQLRFPHLSSNFSSAKRAIQQMES